MKRREFIAGLGSATAWPLVARAQQPAVPVIGFLLSGSPPFPPPLRTAFLKGLNEIGYLEGRNVAIEYRWAHDELDRLPELANDLVHLKSAVIVTPASQAARAPQKPPPRPFQSSSALVETPSRQVS